MRIFKRILPALILFACVAIPAHTGAQNPQNFSFESFNADYSLDRTPDGAAYMWVMETLVADFPDSNQNHGILRAIPERYQNHSLRLDYISVTDENGKPYPYTAYDQNDNRVLKIGDPNSYVHGKKVYIISYQLKDVISFYKDHDELFWDINGDQWGQPFKIVVASFHITPKLTNNLQDRLLCYKGEFNSNQRDCSIARTITDGTATVTASASNLQPQQTLSAVLAFKPGTFQLSPVAKKELRLRKIELVASIVLAISLPLGAFIFMFRRWRQFGDDPKGRGVIVPEYEPPKGFNALNSDYLLHEELRSKAVSAWIIEHAVAGHITVFEIPKNGLLSSKDYQLQLNSIPSGMAPVETKILAAIFGESLTAGTKVSLNAIKKDTRRQLEISKILQDTDKDLSKYLFEGGYFIKDPKKVREGYQIWAIVISILSGFAAFFAASLPFAPLWGLFGGMAAAAVMIFIFASIMPARSEAGVAVHDALLGLKDYIKLAEADRLKFLQSPQGAEKLPVADQFDPKTAEAKVKLFEKLLPYAMLFGMEKDWAKQFDDIYTTPPGWYQGGSWTAFNAGYLAGSLSDFNSASSTSFASPSSSSGSGFSGGGAGGGGGGGGGGGW